TGRGIGGAYASITSTIQELIPSRYRGWPALAINGSFWVGAALGAGGSVLLLDPRLFAVDIGWRLCFMIGASLSLVIFVMRLWLPESPRWLMTHGQGAAAAAVVEGSERRFEAAGYRLVSGPLPRMRFRGRHHIRLGEVIHTLFWVHRQRALVGLSLMASQAFFYNAIFFTYALVLTDFYGVPADRIGWY